MNHYKTLTAPVGAVGILVTDDGLAGIILTRGSAAQARTLMQRRYPEARYDERVMPSLQRQIETYFAGRRVRFRVRTDLSGLTPFQREVLHTCEGIGYGETVTYGELARRVGRPDAYRAVGNALARNPIPLVIPCHRVVAAGGALGGFSAEQGVSLKRWLLDLESGSCHGHRCSELPCIASSEG